MTVYVGVTREDETYALPDGWTFYHDCTNSGEPCPEPFRHCAGCAEFECGGIGWYYSEDGVLIGPFETEEEAAR